LLAILAMVVVIDNLDRPLANPDEGRYAEIGRGDGAERRLGDARLNGIKYFEKPPLQYWADRRGVLGAAACRIRGAPVRGALLPCQRSAGGAQPRGAWATPMRASPQASRSCRARNVMLLGGVVTLDTGLTLWITLTLCSFILSEREEPGSSARRRWMLVAWAAMALAVLQKGLVASCSRPARLRAGACCGATSRRSRGWSGASGCPLFLAIAAHGSSPSRPPTPSSRASSSSTSISSASSRPDTAASSRGGYFLPILGGGDSSPGCSRCPRRCDMHGGSRAMRAAAADLRLAMLGALLVVAFFSASGSKLPAYILPAFPMLALVLGRYLAEAPTRKLALQVMPIMIVGRRSSCRR
jgi:4-amino-4-deoxy-L-arabinose transferase-like glycosyltransferase